MKNLLIFLFAIITLLGCEDIQTNSPALQGEVDGIFFKALDTQIIENEDGSFTIQGISLDETVTLKISSPAAGTYILGGGSDNFAIYENAAGQIYSSNPEGDGKVIVTSEESSVNVLSGTFNFTAILSGVDTLTIGNGIFFEIPYLGEGDDNPNAGTFSAEIDGIPFIPFSVSAADTGNSIVIIGAGISNSITLGVPVDVAVGSYDLPSVGFIARYSVDLNTEDAEEGTIFIVEHDIANKTIKGTFSFKTASYTISLGQFNVSYQ